MSENSRPRALGDRPLARAAIVAVIATPALAAAFFCLLAASLALPDEPIARNIREDAVLLEHPRIHSFTGRKIDVGTECIGVSFGLGDDAAPFDAAVRSPTLFDCPTMLAYVERREAAARPYTHYWHGYAAISRPLLSLFPYHDLRMLTFNVMVGLIAILAHALVRAAGARFAIAALLPFYFVNYSGFLELWTKAAGWMVMLVAAIIIARRTWDDRREPYLVFYFAGAATAFLDLFTTPLLVFGFPAALYLLLATRAGRLPPRRQIRALAHIGAFWTLGYAGLWLMKIAVAAVVIGPEVWAATLESAAFRIAGPYESVKHFLGAATLENFEAFKGTWGALAFLTFVIAPFVRAEGRARFAALFRGAPGVMLLAGAPFIWYEIFSNHSQIHGLFTHANLALTFLPSSLVLAKAADCCAPPADLRQAAG